MCQVLGVSKSGYYTFVKRFSREETEREAFNRHVDERILFHYHDNLGCYGSPRIHNELVKENIPVSERKVSMRMKELDIRARPSSLFVSTTDSDHDQPIYENHLNRHFQPEAPNQAWATDITYIHTGEVSIRPGRMWKRWRSNRRSLV
ncbi:IS3 family transposase [Alteribacillus sp. JSM 102045]|uniref:IS3 family transposase n=1 Tax=Alteribacillus sp. JSM 102045 TaxID=1562101 RepID=UPI0035C035B0